MMTDNRPIKQIKNVRLETGFIHDDFEIIATATDLYTLDIEEGKITKIHQEVPSDDAFDAKGYLLLPPMKDMHIHLDKTYYGGPWKARSKRQQSVQDMIALEQQILPDLLKETTYRANKIIDLQQSHGTNFTRVHCNIEPTSKLEGLERVQAVINQRNKTFDFEVVAFPQHGLFYTDSVGLMKEASQMDIDFIGGLDPTTIDGNLEKVTDVTLQLALDYQKGIDIHLHETGKLGLKTISHLVKMVNENPILKGKTYLSHCYVLGTLNEKKVDEVATQLAEAQIGIISTVSIGKLVMPIPQLLNRGVYVPSGTDSVIDHWQPFGLANMLQKANVMAESYTLSDEFGLSRCLKIATNHVTPLNDEGKQVWPKVGDEASFNLYDASCSAEAVARISPLKGHFCKGINLY